MQIRRRRDKMTFGQVIASARKKAYLSQKELASKIKKEDGQPISPQYLNDIEHDKRNPPSPFFIDQLAEALQVAPEYLYYLANELTSDIRDTGADPEKVVAAYNAFRKVIRDS